MKDIAYTCITTGYLISGGHSCLVSSGLAPLNAMDETVKRTLATTSPPRHLPRACSQLLPRI